MFYTFQNVPQIHAKSKEKSFKKDPKIFRSVPKIVPITEKMYDNQNDEYYMFWIEIIIAVTYCICCYYCFVNIICGSSWRTHNPII
jgi:hypothetical protein